MLIIYAPALRFRHIDNNDKRIDNNVPKAFTEHACPVRVLIINRQWSLVQKHTQY